MMSVETLPLPDSSGNVKYVRKKNRWENGRRVNSKPSEDSDDDKTIHSGHFMLSRVHDHDPSPALGEDDGPRVSPSKDASYDFRQARQDTSKTYTFNTKTIAIDETLTKLFECMSLAYSGKLTSPKWKQFRGLQLTIKDKIRLNNLIWREWCMQYVHGKNSVVCQFATPLSDDIHNKPEAIVLEGKYWKRRLDTVTFEYKKWRRYYYSQRKYNKNNNDQDLSDLLEKVKDVTKTVSPSQPSSTDVCLNSTDFMEMDLGDELFNQLNQSSFTFPNPRELMGFGISNLMQPGLIPLQPPLDDTDSIMDFEDFLQPSKPANSVVHFTAGSSSPISQKMYPGGDFGTASSSMTSLRALLQPQSATAIQIPPKTVIQTPPPPVAMPTPPQPQGAAGWSNSMIDFLNLLNLAQQSPENNSQIVSFLAAQLLADTQSNQPNPLLLQIQQYQQQQQQLLQQQQQQQQQQQLLQQLLQVPQQQQAVPQQQQTISQQQQTISQQAVPQQQQTISHQQQTILQQQVLPQQQMVVQQQQVLPQTAQQQQTFLIQTNQQPLQQQLYSSQQQQLFEVKEQSGSVNKSTNNDKRSNQNVSPLQAALLGQSTLSGQKKSKVNSRMSNKATAVLPSESMDTAAVPAVKTTKSSTPKSSREFVIPKSKGVRHKPRASQTPLLPKTSSPSIITSTPSQQSTYLAQLLTTGTYPGAAIKVEKDARLVSPPPLPAPVHSPGLSHLQSIRPQELSTDMPNTISSQTITLSVQEVSDLGGGISLFGSPASITAGIATEDFSLDCTTSPSFKSSTGSVMVDTSTPSQDTSNQDMGSPLSDTTGNDSPRGRHSSGDGSTRRVSHISAEQKRRCNIKNGFDVLHTLIPALSLNPSAKVSKAAMLQKTADYCKKLKAERAQMQNEAEILKQEIESLNQSISQCQSQLPATGVPVTRQRADQMKEMFDGYVKNRTLENWKFYIFSIMVKPLFLAYNNMVSTASVDELCRTTMAWLDQHCSLVALRPTILNALRQLSTSTSILTDPARLPEQATEAVIKAQKKS